MVNPGLLKLGGVVLAVLIVGATGVVVYQDRQSQADYQAWARAENQKVFDASTKQRLTEQQLRTLGRQLNDSFYQRLEDHLPVRVLVVGDAYGAGMGASSAARSWAQLLKTELAAKYGVTVELTNVSLSAQNGGFAAWTALHQQADGAGSAMLAERIAAGTATVSEEGEISAEGWDSKEVHAFREKEYDLAIVSLGMTDDPTQFGTWYEAVLRGLREKYRQCSVISLLSNQAMTNPSHGYADENADALYEISDRYHADVLNVGMEMLDPEAAAQGATTSELAEAFGAKAQDTAGAGDAAAEGGAVTEAAENAAGDTAENQDTLQNQLEAAQAMVQKYTKDGLYLSDAGQKFLADTLSDFIGKKVADAQGYAAGEITLLSPEVEALDEFHYVPVTELNRVNDYTYVLGKNQMRRAEANDGSDMDATYSGDAAIEGSAAAGAGAGGLTDAGKTAGSTDTVKAGSIVRHSEHQEGDFFRGIVGVDYALVSGGNDLYLATGDGTHPFGRLTVANPYSSAMRSVAPVNDAFSADRDGNLILSFGTKAQADGLKGVVFGGDLPLPETLDQFKTVAYVGPTDADGKPLPLDDDGRVVEGGDTETEDAVTKGQKGVQETRAQKPTATKTQAQETLQPEAKMQETQRPETTTSEHNTVTSAGSDDAGKRVAESSSAAKAQSEAKVAEASPTEGTSASSDQGTGNTSVPEAETAVTTAPRETEEGRRVLTEEERLAILERVKSSEAANPTGTEG